MMGRPMNLAAAARGNPLQALGQRFKQSQFPKQGWLGNMIRPGKGMQQGWLGDVMSERMGTNQPMMAGAQGGVAPGPLTQPPPRQRPSGLNPQELIEMMRRRNEEFMQRHHPRTGMLPQFGPSGYMGYRGYYGD